MLFYGASVFFLFVGPVKLKMSYQASEDSSCCVLLGVCSILRGRLGLRCFP